MTTGSGAERSMEALDAQDPRTVGGYRVLGRLGEGGMGRVYFARNTGGRSVALKLIHGDMASVPGFRDRFRREVEAVRSVSGTGTVPVVDAGVDERRPWYASEYVPGPSLQHAVNTYGPLPGDALWRFAADLAETLEHVHGKGLVHRDLKPSNVLLATARPRLIDFGIVHVAVDTALTVSGARIGTPAYMSPEQAYGEQVTAASDIYSYGLTLAFAASGQVPRRGTLAGQLPDVEAALLALIQSCLDPESGRRPTAAQLSVQARSQDPTADTWLPAPVASLIARTSEELLNLEARDDQEARAAHHWPPRTEADPQAERFGFHNAFTQGPYQTPPRPSTPPPPQPSTPPPTPPPSTPPPYLGQQGWQGQQPWGWPGRQSTQGWPSTQGARGRQGQQVQQGWQGTGSKPVPGHWVHEGFLGRPLIGLACLGPLGFNTVLAVLTLPTFMTWVRLLATTGLLLMACWLTSQRSRHDRLRWFKLNQAYWLVLGVFTIQGLVSTAGFSDKLTLAAAMEGRGTSFLEGAAGALVDVLNLPVLIGALGLIYVVPSVIGRFIRAGR
ncbi:serine/threonine-protein kinase [Streptomyces sp. NPDC127084]|uniref:serine/threonine-protein kinase n=1 Tax=Streptomyces sp. NPDC127084 TaxID=3347133 RepID=UPI00365B3B46